MPPGLEIFLLIKKYFYCRLIRKQKVISNHKKGMSSAISSELSTTIYKKTKSLSPIENCQNPNLTTTQTYVKLNCSWK